MLRISVCLLVACLCATTAHGQNNNDSTASPYDQPERHFRKHWCAARVTGLVLVPVGAVSYTIGGYVLALSLFDRDSPVGAEIAFVGGAMTFVAGLGLFIGGTIHDHRYNRRFALIAPERNEAGIAYNF